MLPRSAASSCGWFGKNFGFLLLVLDIKGIEILSWKPSGEASRADCGRGCGLEFYCCIRFGHCLFRYSISQWKIKGGRGPTTPRDN